MPAESKARTGGTSGSSEAMDKAMVLKVDDAAAASLGNFKPGDKVVLTCRDDMSGSGSTGSTGSSGSTGSTSPGSSGMSGSSANITKCDTVVAITKSY
jgi:hypothetical protein